LAVAAAVGGLVVGAAVQSRVGDNSPPTLQALAASAMHEPGARVVTLRQNKVAVADVVVTANGRGYVTGVALPALDAEHTYQLWGLPVVGDPVSLGVLGRHPTVASFTADATLAQIAISVERRGGAVAPTSSPLAGTLHRA
jgi:anti-sigma-K factor RskA